MEGLELMCNSKIGNDAWGIIRPTFSVGNLLTGDYTEIEKDGTIVTKGYGS